MFIAEIRRNPGRYRSTIFLATEGTTSKQVSEVGEFLIRDEEKELRLLLTG